MWLARLFGGRKVTQDDEPARFAAPASAKTLQPVKRPPSADKPKTVQAKSGFDPYNSGSFQRGNAWERVVRR